MTVQDQSTATGFTLDFMSDHTSETENLNEENGNSPRNSDFGYEDDTIVVAEDSIPAAQNSEASPQEEPKRRSADFALPRSMDKIEPQLEETQTKSADHSSPKKQEALSQPIEMPSPDPRGKTALPLEREVSAFEDVPVDENEPNTVNLPETLSQPDPRPQQSSTVATPQNDTNQNRQDLEAIPSQRQDQLLEGSNLPDAPA